MALTNRYAGDGLGGLLGEAQISDDDLETRTVREAAALFTPHFINPASPVVEKPKGTQTKGPS